MDLAALGLPMEQVRNVWLVAFFIYLACCLLVEVAYPTLIGASRAREVYTSVMGSPVEDVKEAITELADAGTHLTPEQEEAAFRRAEAQLESIKGSNIIMDFGHILVYGWACVIVYSTFVLYWDMAYDGILIPGLLLPFLMVYWAARWGRRTWRKARSIDTDDTTAGLPQIYSAALMRLNLFAVPNGAHPQAKPVRAKNDFYVETHFVLVLALIVFFYSLVGWTVLGVQPMPIGGASITLAIVTTVTVVTRWVYMRRYLLFNPDSFYIGRLFLPAKKYRYTDIVEFCVFPKNPEQIKPTFYEPSQWQIEIKVPSKIPPNLAKRIPWLRRHIVAVHDERVVCLTSQVAFYLEQERWADLRSPADREKLAEYFTNGNIVCTSLGYKPVSEEQP